MPCWPGRALRIHDATALHRASAVIMMGGLHDWSGFGCPSGENLADHETLPGGAGWSLTRASDPVARPVTSRRGVAPGWSPVSGLRRNPPAEVDLIEERGPPAAGGPAAVLAACAGRRG